MDGSYFDVFITYRCVFVVIITWHFKKQINNFQVGT